MTSPLFAPRDMTRTTPAQNTVTSQLLRPVANAAQRAANIAAAAVYPINVIDYYSFLLLPGRLQPPVILGLIDVPLFGLLYLRQKPLIVLIECSGQRNIV